MIVRARRALATATLPALAGCVATPPVHDLPPAPSMSAGAGSVGATAAEPVGDTAAAVGIARVDGLPPIAPERAATALAAFRLSCPALVKRTDLSGLTRPGDWDELCAEASRVPTGAEAAFFARMTPVRVGGGALFATGYYEPELAGSRTRRAGYDAPLYRTPGDLLDIDLGRFSSALAGKRLRGRLEGGTLVPYPDRAAIEDGALAGRGLELAWAADLIDVFFLQIQGSGRLRLPDGGVMRVGYAGQNGHDYTAIGRLLRERGQLASGEATMDGIVAWLRANPAAGVSLMRENAGYVFFRELTGPGPLGALGLPVTPRVSVAADPRFVPLGAPVYLQSDRTELNGLWVAQDTGGAIKGPNRFDSFWGAGDQARTLAGGLSAHGSALVLLPEASVRRLLGPL